MSDSVSLPIDRGWAWVITFGKYYIIAAVLILPAGVFNIKDDWKEIRFSLISS